MPSLDGGSKGTFFLEERGVGSTFEAGVHAASCVLGADGPREQGASPELDVYLGHGLRLHCAPQGHLKFENKTKHTVRAENERLLKIPTWRWHRTRRPLEVKMAAGVGA